MKYILIYLLTGFWLTLNAQSAITGSVFDGASGEPLSGVSVRSLDHKSTTITDGRGEFELRGIHSSGTLELSKSEYETTRIAFVLPLLKPLRINLQEKAGLIEEVQLTTGYQKIPKERATGSFAYVDSKTLELQVGTGIIERLAGVTPGILMNNGTRINSEIMVRGLSTITGPKSPLIVVDNFPYEGDLNNINPNMVESVTVLKDAAAASIWGARAANGVIVITTKMARKNRPFSINFTSNTTISGKPDLKYIAQISSRDYIEMEKELFTKGYYNSDLKSTSKPIVSPVVDLLDRQSKGLISSELVNMELERLKGIDARDQFLKYMYRSSINQQFSLDFSYGTDKLSWMTNLGYDRNEDQLGSLYNRLNIRIQNNWTPVEKLSITSSIYYTNVKTENGRSAYGSTPQKNTGFTPYFELANELGRPKNVYRNYSQAYKNSFEEGQLLDWNYYPLTDWQHNSLTTEDNEILFSLGLKYEFLKGLEFDFKYQHQRNVGETRNFYDRESFYTRDYINRFAQVKTGQPTVYQIPFGEILSTGISMDKSTNYRGQFNLDRTWNKHQVTAIVGGETRAVSYNGFSNRFFGYDQRNLTYATMDETKSYSQLPRGTATIGSSKGISERNYRYVSVFGNAAYTFDRRYTISASARRDASNLFGLNTNEKWNPFWSVGASWNIAAEPFYSLELLQNLSLRTSYGFNGNIDPAMVAVTTISYDSSLGWHTGTQTARISNNYNPELRWETVGVLNFGLDFSSQNHRVSGSLEYFKKSGENMFGEAALDPTTGIPGMKWNVADFEGDGIDVTLRVKLLNRGFKWTTVLNHGAFKDKVTKYLLKSTIGNRFVSSTVPVSGVEGQPVYSIYAYKWGGLDPENGDPLGFLDGELSKNYSSLVGMGTNLKDLQYFGSAIPTSYGSFINSFNFKHLGLEVGIQYKLGYFFRTPSVFYTNLYRSWVGHSDYAKRWQNSGDENRTSVPSSPLANNQNRDSFYEGSSVLIEKGDHIRLNFLALNYDLSHVLRSRMGLKNLGVHFNVQNLGILWRANKKGIDPDLNMGAYSAPSTTTFTFGIKSNF